MNYSGHAPADQPDDGLVEANPQKLAGKAENPHSADLS